MKLKESALKRLQEKRKSASKKVQTGTTFTEAAKGKPEGSFPQLVSPQNELHSSLSVLITVKDVSWNLTKKEKISFLINFQVLLCAVTSRIASYRVKDVSHAGIMSELSEIFKKMSSIQSRLTTQEQAKANLSDPTLSSNNTNMTDGLQIVTWNVNGLNDWIEELKYYHQDHKIDIAFISETHYSTRSHPKLLGFVIYHTPHPDGGAHGGSAVIIRRNIQHHIEEGYKEEKAWNVIFIFWFF